MVEKSAKLDSKYQWNKTNCDNFKTNLSSEEIGRKFSQIFETLNNVDCTESINSCEENFVSVIDDVCKPLFEKKV